MDETTNRIRYGGQGLLAVRQKLICGGWSALLLEEGALRDIRYRGKELLRSLYPTFRDRNWTDVPPRIVSLDVVVQGADSLLVYLVAEHIAESIDYGWTGTYTFAPDGTLICKMAGTARKDLWKNRLGFCLLHPLDTAGCGITYETPEGTYKSAVPGQIVPVDPFTDMRWLRIEDGAGWEYRLVFEGELFHMEDQRNWSDGSLKTFGPPLSQPYPVLLPQGRMYEQAVRLEVCRSPEVDDRSEESDVIRVANETVGAMPELGTVLTGAELREDGTDAEAEALRKLALRRLRLPLVMEKADWAERFAKAVKLAASAETQLDVELLVSQSAHIRIFFDLASAFPGIVRRVALYPYRAQGTDIDALPVPDEVTGASRRACAYATQPPLLAEARRCRSLAGCGDIRVGGGSRGHFTEFNRMTFPVEQMEFMEYALTPQAHAADLATMVESLPAQKLTAVTARRTKRPPLLHAVVTLKPRMNPYGADDEAVIASQQAACARDPRSGSLFAAGWTIGSIYQLASGGADSIDYDELTGEATPVYSLFARLAGQSGRKLFGWQGDESRYSVLCWEAEDGIALLIGNLTNEFRTVTVELPSMRTEPLRMVVYDETSLPGTASTLEPDGNRFSVTLRPYAFHFVKTGNCPGDG